MRIRTELLLSFFIIAVSMSIVGFIHVTIIDESAKESFGKTAKIMATSTMFEIDEKIHNRIEQLKSFSEDSDMTARIIISNTEFQQIPDVKSYIARVDKDWIEGKNTPEIDAVFQNENSQFLIQKITEWKEDYGYQIFHEFTMTNEHGVIIGTTGITSDYDQSDDWWYKNTRELDSIYVQPVEYDVTADEVVIGVVIPIKDSNENFIGTFKGYIDVNQDIKHLIDFVKQTSDFNHFTINVVDSDGLTIFQEHAKTFTEDVLLSEFGERSESSSLLPENSENNGYFFWNNEQNEFVSAFAKSEGFGNYYGQNWTTIIDFNSNEIFESVSSYRDILFILSLSITGLSVVIGLLMTKRIAVPISSIAHSQQEVSKGNFDVMPNVSGPQEIKTFGKIFESMLESIKRTIALEKEISRLEEKEKQDKLSVIGEFAAKIAHDLRNPLSIIKNSMYLVKNPPNDKPISQYLDTMSNALDRIEHQINNVMDFVRTRPLTKQKISIRSLLDNVIKDIVIPESVVMSLPSNDATINADETQLTILFTNLITNSMDAIDNKGKITINIIEKNDFVEIDVSDSGEGIPDEILPKIFDPLFTTKQKGTGLGLASCNTIVDTHGGTISVKNNPTTFIIKLPKDD